MRFRSVAARLVACVIVGVVLASCTATATTVGSASSSGATDASASTSLGQSASEPDVPSCPYLDPRHLPDLEDGIASILSGASLVDASSDPCVVRFATADEWVELRFQAADESIAMFGDANLMTNGVDTTRATLANGQLVDVVASASSPQSISTWDASITGAFVVATPG